MKTTGKDADIAARRSQEVLLKERYVKSAIVFRRVDVIGRAILIEEKGEISRHLAILKVTTIDRVLGIVGPRSAWQIESLKVSQFRYAKKGSLDMRCVVGPHSRVGSETADEAKWSIGTISYRNAAERATITAIFWFEMKPHHKFAGLRVKENLRPFEDTAGGDFTLRVGRDGESDATIFPIIEIIGGISMHADMGPIAVFAFDLMLAVPIVGIFVKEEASPVRIDGSASGVLPSLPRMEGGEGR